MYVANSVISSSFDLFSYIEDSDVFNSKMIYDLSHAAKYTFKVTENENRVDLIARQLYGADGDRYYPILILLNNKFTFEKGETIYYISLDTINSVIRNL